MKLSLLAHASLCFGALSCVAAVPTQIPLPQTLDSSLTASGQNGAVASEDIRCSQIGVDVLKENGTAADAAIATAVCIGVVNFFSSGIGGGGFMVVKQPPCRGVPGCQPQTPISIDFRETSPAGESYAKAFLKDPKLSQFGGMAVAIPGEIAGFEAAYRLAGGGVSWKRLFEPSIQLAKNFTIGPKLAKMLYHDGNTDHSLWMRKSPEWSKMLFPDGRQTKAGDPIQRTQYANTLQMIADAGNSKPFYRGEIARKLVQTINQDGGKVNITDFANYKANVRPALNTTYLGRNVWTTQAPSSGPMLLHLLNVLEGYSFKDHPRTALSDHRFAEALKYAFAARTELGDPRFLNVTQNARLGQIRSKAYSAEIHAKIDDSRTYDYQHYNPLYDTIDDHGTTHLSVVDKHGSTVAMTSTINLIFGARLMDPETGIVLNDENDDFSIPGSPNFFGLLSSPFNHPEKNKRPISSIAPIIVEGLEGGEMMCTYGASGGSRIFSAIAGSFLKLDWGYSLASSIDDPRLHHQLRPNQAVLETGYSPEFVKVLQEKGHNVTLLDINLGTSAVQAIVRQPDGTFVAASDKRKHGGPAAY